MSSFMGSVEEFPGSASVADGYYNGGGGDGGGAYDNGTYVTGAPSEMNDASMKHVVHKVIDDMRQPEFASVLDDTLRHLMAGQTDPGQAAAAGNAAAGTAAAQLFASLSGDGIEGAESLAKTLEVLQRLSLESDAATAAGSAGAHTAGGISGESAAATEKLSDDLMSRMTEEFERLGNKEDFDSAMDGVMRQLLAKDIMYVPIRQIADRFPEWLAHNRGAMSDQEYQRYGHQYQVYQQLAAVYETDPDNFPHLLELMQDMQELGQPPDEIVKELAPGLELSSDGMPMLPNMGPGIPTLPALPGVGCTIM